MAELTTSSLSIPKQILDPWIGKIQSGSTVATLSPSQPMLFGEGEFMTFDIGEAEYVGEGANKGDSTITPTTKTVKPFKFHKTVRWTNEVQWADEDHQLQVISQVLDLIAPALARALDYGVYHGINPTGGTAVAAMTEYLSQTTNTVAASGSVITDVDAATTLVLADEYVPDGIAVGPSYASGIVTTRNTDQVKLFPEFAPTTAASSLEGLTASASKTVSAVSVADTATDIEAFVGDFDGIRWGIQRNIGLEMIEYGDPDGNGDLKRNNQVAFRSEVVYGWGIGDLNAFASITGAGS